MCIFCSCCYCCFFLMRTIICMFDLIYHTLDLYIYAAGLFTPVKLIAINCSLFSTQMS